MKVAIAVWENHVSSVLDFSQRLVVVEFKGGGEASRAEIALLERSALAKLVKLRELGIDVLICGAVSRRLALASTASGIRLLPYVTGKVEDVLNAYRAGELGLPEFMLPGWWPGARRGFRWQRRRHRGQRGARRHAGGLDTSRWCTTDGDGV